MTRVANQIGLTALCAIPLTLSVVADDGGVPDGQIVAETKISATQGGLGWPLDDFDSFGWSQAYLDDFDGDGIGDLAVGTPHDGDEDNSKTNSGAVYLVRLKADGSVKLATKINNTLGGLQSPLVKGDHFGTGVANLDDLDGDGTIDLAVGAFHDAGGGIRRGAVYVLFLHPDGSVKSEVKIGSGTAGLGSLTDFAHFGHAVANIGDVDGDGCVDLAVGAPGNHSNESSPGDLWILFLQPDGTVKSSSRIGAAGGGLDGLIDDGDDFGCAVASIGDLTGDQIPDIVVGALDDDDGGKNRGALWVIHLRKNGTIKLHQKISATTGGFDGSLDNFDNFGRSVADMGDLDGDGVPDIAVGAYKDDDGALNAGALWVLFLNGDGTVKSWHKESATVGGFGGAIGTDDGFGQSVVAIGDRNGDGVTDLSIGAWWDDDGGMNPLGRQGAVWICDLHGHAAPTGPWIDLGGALAGTKGDPILTGTGELIAGQLVSLAMSNAVEDSSMTLVIGSSQVDVPLLGGTLVPSPDIVIPGFPTGHEGEVTLTAPWPTGLPSGVSLVMQYWIVDPVGPFGVAATNGVMVTTP